VPVLLERHAVQSTGAWSFGRRGEPERLRR
jgi:hypothetical protein